MSALLLGDAWQMKTCVLKSAENIKHVCDHNTLRDFLWNLSAVICRLADFPQLASTCSDCKIGGRNQGKNGLRRKRTGQFLSDPKSSFQMKVNLVFYFGNQGPRVWRKRGEAQNPCCLKSSVKFTESVMVWAAMSSAGVGPLCFLKSTVNAAIYQEILEHFMLPSADKLYKDADFIFQQDLAPAHTAKGTKSW